MDKVRWNKFLHFWHKNGRSFYEHPRDSFHSSRCKILEDRIRSWLPDKEFLSVETVKFFIQLANGPLSFNRTNIRFDRIKRWINQHKVTITLQFEQHFWAAEHSDSFFNLQVIWSQQGSVSSQFSKLPQSQSSFSSTMLLPQCWLGLVICKKNSHYLHK